jgi:Accessory colonization factor AcfC, contains ABC-type periplasmic domain
MEGKRADLYVVGGDIFGPAEKENFIASKELMGYRVPVFLVEKGNPKKITKLQDLTKPGIKLFLVHPSHCQLGKLSEKILIKNGIDMKAIRGNLVRPMPPSYNDKLLCPCYLPMGKLIKEDKLDAAIVWDSQAASWTDQADIVLIPKNQNIIFRMAIILPQSCQNKNLAKKFTDFLTSDRAKSIFKKYNFRFKLPE